ncbi:MAG: isocitrate lyase/phosphoenolpyruvate mutase family protein [Bacillota bacterium]|nr:isocitrate lyase/phosphoenolpyruvate mutase family protein [Bacillota bacterium]
MFFINPTVKPTAKLRAMLAAPGLIVAPGAYDALSARIIARSGFDAVYLTGYGAAASRLGEPDVGLLTMTEMVEQCRAIAAAAPAPVIADADTGYGNALNVRRTVQAYEAAGVAALQLEDQVFPKRCGHMEGKRVIDTAEMVAKLRAAADARTDPDLVIIARTDARAVLGFDAALERCHAYREAGADVIFMEAPESREEMAAVARAIKAPLFANLIERGRTPLIPLDELAAMGYKIAIYPLTALYAAARAVSEAMAELRAKGTMAGWVDRMIPFGDFNELVGLAGYRELERKYSTGQGE